jgi:GNAT superfamily N-acetyltransferase
MAFVRHFDDHNHCPLGLESRGDTEMRFMDLELARRVELAEAHAARTCAEQLRQSRPETNVAVERIAGANAVFAGVGSPMTQAIGIGLDGAPTDSDLDQLEEFFWSRGAAIEMEVCPLVALSLYQLLAARGYRLIEVSNVLVREMAGAETLRTSAPGVSVRAARDDEANLWAQTVARGFAEQSAPTEELVEAMQGFFRRRDACCFIAFADGSVAGGGVVAANEGVGGLFGASTLPAFRRRGVQAALLAERLRWAQSHRCDLAAGIAQPGSGSQRNLERAGFRVAYTRTKLSREKQS